MTEWQSIKNLSLELPKDELEVIWVILFYINNFFFLHIYIVQWAVQTTNL